MQSLLGQIILKFCRHYEPGDLCNLADAERLALSLSETLKYLRWDDLS